MSERLFTLGYEGLDIAEFVRLLEKAGVTALVDVRETAWSHKPGFSKKPLEEALRTAAISYTHAAFAGNPSGIRKTAKSTEDALRGYGRHLTRDRTILDRFEDLVEQLTAQNGSAQNGNVCITCFERDPDMCHRKILAERWRKRGTRKVVHLGTPAKLI